MGVGGQAPGKSESDGAYMPDKLCGEKLFSEDDGIFLRSVLGRIYDGIQKALDQTQHNLMEMPVSL
jgi:hypothetical protein